MQMARKSPFLIGTSGWHYKHWKGPFYTTDVRERDMLKFYADRFSTVEINNSFYQLPKKATFEAWRDLVPTGFVFSVKASRYITHMKKLREPKTTTGELFNRVAVLRDKLGPILFQLPPRWGFDPGRLKAFLESLPGDFRYAMEFRDTSWFEQRAYDLLEERGVAFCIYQLSGLLSPKQVTAPFVYVRLHGPGRRKYEGQYAENDLAAWARSFSAWANQGKAVYCYFDNDQAGYAPKDAIRLRGMLA